MTNDLIPRATVAQICKQRDAALHLFDIALSHIETAADAILAARAAASHACGAINRYNHQKHDDAAPFLVPLKVPTRADYNATARRMVDTNIWAHIVQQTELDSLMDKTAKDQLYQSLLSDPPEATEANIFATVQQFAADSGMIFRRGIATCFSKLDRRFKSHDGWKIGSRIVLTYAFSSFGTWNYHGNDRDTIIDVERAFYVLDGKTPPDGYAGVISAIEESRRGGGLNPRQSFCETEYFRVRGFKNGHAHMWFKRDDLVDKVNQLLGEYYDAPIPHDRGPDDTEEVLRPKMTPAKNYGFFPTPDKAVEDFWRWVPSYRGKDDAPLTYLEPSAGTGQLSKRAAREGGIVDCIEIRPDLAANLKASGFHDAVLNCDFLALRAAQIYDRVIMNPPFDLERDIDHVLHALKFLKPGGHLTAIMSAGTEFRETRKSVKFREIMKAMRAEWHDMPAGSFSSVGTNCNTIVLSVWKREIR